MFDLTLCYIGHKTAEHSSFQVGILLNISLHAPLSMHSNLQQRLRAEEQARDVLSTALEVRETLFTARILWGCF